MIASLIFFQVNDHHTQIVNYVKSCRVDLREDHILVFLSTIAAYIIYAW